MTDWNKAKVVDLKAELKKRGLPQTGLKPALVARLTAADEDGTESEATVQGESLKLDGSAATSPDTISSTQPQSAEALEPVQTIPEPNPEYSEPAATPEVQHVDTPMAEAPSDPLPTESANTIESSQVTSQPEPKRSALPSVEPEEAIEDRQKRKRRSQTPPISSADVARKRARKGDEAEIGGNELPTSQSDSPWIEENNAVDEARTVSTSGRSVENIKQAVKSEEKMEIDLGPKDTRTSKPVKDSPPAARDSRFRDLFPLSESGAHRETLDSRTAAYEDAEPDRNVEPAVHPATAALYIRDFMRPLNPSQLKTYLTELATPPSHEVDSDVIVDFYLDPIRTHAFISFVNISSASRVRSTLHGRIWPEEKTRKPLWVDFVPSESVRDWIHLEESHNPVGRGSGKKWEVHYDVDDERRVTASLQEISNVLMSHNLRKSSTQLTQQALPFQNSSPVTRRGIEGAPSGPRAEIFQEPTQGPIAATNTATLDHLFKSTIAQPVLYWMPVPKELVNKRHDAIDDATSKRYVRGGRADEEINRFTFQDTDVLVDRGPELFGGIRPPPGFRGPAYGPTRGPMRRGGFGRGRGGYDSYRGGGGAERRGSRDERGDDRGGRDFRDDRR